MSREAMKLALEALDNLMYWDNGKSDYDQARQAIAALQEALAKPDFWEGYIPEPDKRQQALDKKAENARELGLDYEPAQQEPVAWCVINNREIIGEPTLYLDGAEEILAGQIEGCGSEIAPLYTSPPAQRTWVGLTDEELGKVEVSAADFENGFVDLRLICRAIEAKLKEKNA